MVRREQQFILWVVLLALASFLVSSDAMAAPANLHDPSGSFTGLLDLVKNSAAQWDAKLRGYAKTLFWLLASIQFVWTFFPLVFKQADFGEIVGELIRFIMVIGFFYALLLFSADWASAVVDSFREAGAAAAGLGSTGIRPGDIFGTAVDLANTVGNVETWNPLTAFMIALSALVVLICFAFIAAFMGLTIIESYVVINASALFMGFGASQWTREYAMAIVRYAVSVGAKLFVLTLIVGLIVDAAKDWAAAYQSNADDASMWTMVGLALTCAYLAKTIPELVAGMISGVSSGGGSSIGGMAAAAVAGAAAAAATIATAGAAAPAAAGAAGSLGGSGAAAGAGGLGGGGLAGAINSSFAGSAGSAAPGAASSMGGASTGGSSAGLGSSTGGSSAAKSAGSKVGGSANGDASSAGPAPQPSQGVQQAAKQATKAAQGDSDESRGQGTPQPQTASQSDQASNSTQGSGPTAAGQGEDKSGAGMSGHQVANALTRGAGILSAISVPGMEGAAGLSLGAGAPQPSPETGDDAESMESSETPQNLIRPAEAPTAPNAPAASGAPAEKPTDTKEE
ncbi:P-type conjugative transfer protein TrbL [Pseudomonas coleopterorum]|uniref:P-type conjugative transfer protein TrbL n=1 Tax=Pseudomonas coleopterorum TaxID=1605838 RepID=UPI0017801C3B|nr:P-type conjugative transfer protein TrbL [Pseudomonas coleopterorum]MBD8483929.1 P-type conjugative transfer protein TrbL [Pseudomonas coleopterorum]